MSRWAAAWIVMTAAPAIAQDAGPPRTVNGQILGSVEDFADHGPARICLESVAIDLSAEETATLQYAGIHSATLRVTTGARYYELTHGDTWANRKRGRSVLERPGFSILRARGSAKARYVLWAATEYSDGERIPVVWIGGTALRGDVQDLPILSRIGYQTTTPADCSRRYGYGWDMLLGDEPVSQRKDETAKP